MYALLCALSLLVCLATTERIGDSLALRKITHSEHPVHFRTVSPQSFSLIPSRISSS